MRRTDGKDGWFKIPCPFSSTGWSWAKGPDRSQASCICERAKPPKGRDYYNQEPHPDE